MLNEKKSSSDIPDEKENDENKPFFLWDYLKEQSELSRPLVLYGTGDGADKILQVMKQYGLEPDCFTKSGDLGGFKPNEVFAGYDVLPLDSIVNKRLKNADFIVLVCFGTDKSDVLERLYSLAKEYEVYVPDVPVVGEGVYTPEYVEENRDKLEKARKLLADEKSKEVFDGWLEYRLSGKPDILEGISSDKSEIYSLLKLNNKEFFVDAGAFKGDTVSEFLAEVGGNFEKITAFEPDVKNYTFMRRKFYALPGEKFCAVNAAAWDEDGTLDFAAKTGRAGSAFSKERVKQVKSAKIDTLCGEDKPTFIKLDVEGAESRVLQGAKSIITKQRPKMVVSLYHRVEDMYELPLLIHSYNQRYKFYLRKTRCLPGWEFRLIVI
ncbi:MAG: FkbM family methyltransferase [Oscillospiraceae bacterium]|nr:FkbM family methyltransferase [Oscillospiraceae bacterium]